ncbi:hypothetical protein, partial [Microcoleus sp. PH2017_28_MFU_U_A]|uniref:hypothetical protein n=1 Tax=Microcoleus sp. PH2017_28_MFU_U_A TaxID=2798838 RepID=UPI001E0DA5B2
KIEVANDKDGKTSIRLGYEIPGAKGGVTFAPDGEKTIEDLPPPAVQSPPPAPISITTPLAPIINSYVPEGDPICLALVGNSRSSWSYYNGVPWHCTTGWNVGDHFGYNRQGNGFLSIDVHPADENKITSLTQMKSPYPFGVRVNKTGGGNGVETSRVHFDMTDTGWGLAAGESVSGEIIVATVEDGLISGFSQNVAPGVVRFGISIRAIVSSSQTSTRPATRAGNRLFIPSVYPESPFALLGKASLINDYLNSLNSNASANVKTVRQSGEKECTLVSGNAVTLQYMVNRLIFDTTPVQIPQNLPNYPQRYKPMNCCDKVEEIYKYLGIAKMKK